MTWQRKAQETAVAANQRVAATWIGLSWQASLDAREGGPAYLEIDDSRG
jgi:hypothetical protein